MSSMSKACFVYKKTATKKRRTTSPTIESSENVEHASRAYRQSLFKKAWKTVEQEVEALHSHTHGQVLGDLLDFVQGASKEMKRWRTNQVIPAATLIAGVNMPDHNAVFTTLQSQVVKRVTPHVVLLTSKDAVSINLLVKTLVASLLSVSLKVNHDEMTEEDDDESAESSPVKRNRLTMSVLASWYCHLVAGSISNGTTADCPSPSKLRKMSREHHERSPLTTSKKMADDCGDSDQSAVKSATPAIVIVLRDLEAFPPYVLQTFVMILSDYFDRLPFILVFGVSTSAFTIHDILTRCTSSKLALETFTIQNPTSYLDVILKKILISSKFHFKLSLKVFRLLEDVFLFNDLSVKTFVSGYKFCMMDHYFENPLSVLCCDWDSMDKRIKRLDVESIECVRRLGSFRTFVEKQQLRDQRALLLDDSHLKGVVHKLIHDYHRYHHDFFPVLYFLHAIVSDLPRFPLGKQLRETYSACLDRDVVDTQEFEDCMNLLNVMAKDELIDRLTRGCEAIQSCSLPSLAVSTIRRTLEGVMRQILKLQEQSLDVEPLAPSLSPTTKVATAVVEETLDKTVPKKRMDRFELQERLKSQMAAKNKQQRHSHQSSSSAVTVYSTLREEAVNIIRDAARRFLTCPTSLPLHDILYYDSATSVQPQLIGGSRAALQMALANPHSYLKCTCCNFDEDGSILSSFPDVCISYKLHLECGRLINLYDWLQAFIMITEQADSQNKSSKEKKLPDQLMARFIRSVAELQFLGFVKGTNRKTDHVARLTW